MHPQGNPFVTRVLFLALIVSQCIYLAIPVPTASGGPPGLLLPALAGVAAAQAAGVLLFFRMAGVARIQSGALDPDTVEGMGRLFVVLILSWVLAEAVAIYGLVLRFLGAPFWQSAVFSIGAFALMALTHPWQSGLRAPMSSAERGRDPTPIG